MKNLNFKPFIYLFLGVSAIMWIGLALLTGIDISRLWDFIKILPNVATIDLILFSAFARWAWRWKIFYGWLVPFPDLNGTWQGLIQTTWIHPETGKQPEPIQAILTIKQSFGKISCVMRTAEMISYSYAEGFKLQEDRQIRQLAYSYTSKPDLRVTERSRPHDGTIVFEIIGNPVKKLRGFYWSDRKTTGEVNLEFREKNLLDELPDDIKFHPVH
jgi:hypothetical protein